MGFARAVFQANHLAAAFVAACGENSKTSKH